MISPPSVADTPVADLVSNTAHLELAEFSMLGGTRIISSAADAERSARLISWLCALVAGRNPEY